MRGRAPPGAPRRRAGRRPRGRAGLTRQTPGPRGVRAGRGPREGAPPPDAPVTTGASATLPTGASVVRRSLLLWGLGHLALGERRLGVALIVAEAAIALVLAWAGPPLAEGSWSGAVLVGGLAILGAWAAIGLDAYRRAVRARLAAGLPGPDGGALGLLWLAPVAIAGSVLLWGTGGLARPETTLARYVGAWRAGDAAAVAGARELFLARRPADLAAVWARQVARLTNELVREAGTAGPEGGIDPYRPFESVRFVERTAGTGDAAGAAGAADVATIAVTVVRREAVRGTLAGILPTTSQVLVPVADLGTVTLRRVERPSGRLGVPASQVWLIERVDLLGDVIP